MHVSLKDGQCTKPYRVHDGLQAMRNRDQRDIVELSVQ